MTSTIPEEVEPQADERLSGVLLMLGSAVSFSTIGLFTRAVSLPLADLLFIRGLFGTLAIWVVARLFTRRRVLDRANFRWPSLCVAGLFTLGMTSLVAAYRVGTVVNVSVVYAMIPLVIGLFQLVFLRRRTSPVFWTCGLGVVAGVAIMTGGGLSTGDAAGMALALLMTVCVAAIIMITRAHRDTPMLIASGMACLLSSAVAAPFVSGYRFDPRDFAVSALFGAVTLGLGRVFLILGSGRVPSGDAALIDVLDAPMTPIWTWAVLGEAPSKHGAVGGCVVLLAVLAGVHVNREH
ncbi:DMT family transporter [Actinomadura syzygii]|uniref:DMT family transporter n=1 Tax=Actinomadura syzygii TaxID=1427538 RepID=A0A5D0U6G9_9ACTN|nr:DMT family transporter [Actinomadura syzygii]TYC13266.1 DMT family transporter [Actinomadura syzygii]